MKIFDMKPVMAEPLSRPDSDPALSHQGIRQRRSWTLAEKLAIVAEVENGAAVTEVAQRHGMNVPHLQNWIAQAKAGTLGRRAGKQPDTVEAEQDFIELGVFSADTITAALGGGTFEISVPSGVKAQLPLTTAPEIITRVARALRAA